MDFLYIKLVSNYNKFIKKDLYCHSKCKLNYCRETPVTDVRGSVRTGKLNITVSDVLQTNNHSVK